MQIVKLTFPFPNWDLKRQTPGSNGVWGNFKFFINEEIDECDYWFVFDHLSKPSEKVVCPTSNIVLLTGEPSSIKQYSQTFIDQFSHVITCQPEINHRNITYHHTGHPWFIGAKYETGKYVSFTKSYDDLVETSFVEKTEVISLITSDKIMTEGHRRRYDFALRLKSYFGDTLHLYGRGINEFSDKYETLAKYRYSIAIENFTCQHWFTEKLYDCYLAHTFPLYHGCPNIAQYFGNDSFKPIDISSFDQTVQSIKSLIDSDSHYESHLTNILQQKKVYLNNYNIFPLIANFISNNLSCTRQKGVMCTLENQPKGNPAKRFFQRFGSLLCPRKLV